MQHEQGLLTEVKDFELLEEVNKVLQEDNEALESRIEFLEEEREQLVLELKLIRHTLQRARDDVSHMIRLFGEVNERLRVAESDQNETIEELRAYNKVLQWRIDSDNAQQQQQQFSQLAQQSHQNQQLAQQNAINAYSQQALGSQALSPNREWRHCTCVPARHDALFGGVGYIGDGY
jgi:hypothetical protein